MEIAIKMAVIIILIVCLIFVCFGTYQVFGTMNVVYDATQQAVLSQVTVNAPGALAGFRESSGTARSYDGDGWSYSIDDSEVMAYLTEAFKLDDAGTRYNGFVRQFSISNIKTLGANSEGSNITFTATVNVAMPVYFGGARICDISKVLKVKATYDKKY